MSIEQKVSDTISEAPREVHLGGIRYKVKPPTFRRLARISAEASQIESEALSPDTLPQEVLRTAHTMAPHIARLLAVMIDDAEATTPRTRSSLWQRLFRRKHRPESLAERILRTATPREASEAVATLLGTLEIGDFFALTTFLQGINLTRRTKVDETTATTAPTPSSPA